MTMTQTKPYRSKLPRTLLPVLFLLLSSTTWASKLLIPMDNTQRDHLKA
jgi:hypothetical protein